MSSSIVAIALALAALVGLRLGMRLFGRYLMRSFGYARTPLRAARSESPSREHEASASQSPSPFGEERRSSPFGEE